MSDGEFPFDPGIEFDEAEAELGRQFVNEGAVEITEDGDDGFFEASVRHFKKTVWVSLRRVDDGFEPECDCPHFEDTGKGCEHLFALLNSLSQPTADAEEDEEVEGRELKLRYDILAEATESSGRLTIQIRDLETGDPIAIDLDTWSDLDVEEDLAALRALAPAAGGWRDARRGGGLARPRGPWQLDGGAAAGFLRPAVATGRLAWIRESELPDSPEFIRPPIEGPCELVLAPVAKSRGQVELRAFLSAPDGRMRLDEASFVVRRKPREVTGAFAVLDHRMVEVETFGGDAWMKTLRRGAGLLMDAEKLPSFLLEMELNHPLPRLALEHEAAPIPLDAEAIPVVAIGVTFRAGLALIGISFIYGDAAPCLPERPGELVLDLVRGRQHRRLAAAESAAVERLLADGAENDPDRPGRWMMDSEDAPTRIQGWLSEGFRVRVEGRALRRGHSASFKIRREGEGLVVSGGVESEGEILSLPALLEGMRRPGPFIELGDGTSAMLDEEAQRSLDAALPRLDLGSIRQGADEQPELYFGAAQALFLSSLDAESDAGFAELCDRLDAWSEIEVIEPPPELQADLRPYQQRGLSWLAFLDDMGLGGVLADDMGLGKTLQSIAFWLERRRRGPVGAGLVVVPRSLIGNWQREFARFAPDVSVHVYHGPRRTPGDLAPGSVLLTTWGVLQRDQELLQDLVFDTVFLDEAQAIKNAASKTARAARSLRADRRIALSGTPIENDLGELWSLMEFCNPGLLGSRKAFAQRWAQAPGEELLSLKRAIAPVLLRRTKAEVAPDLPDLIEQTIVCEMNDAQARQYQELSASLKARMESAPNSGTGNESEMESPVHILEALLRLRQIACHPALVGGDGDSGKIDLLMTRLGELVESGGKALVFSQFTSLLEIVRTQFRKTHREPLWLDGSTRDRETPIQRFQEDEKEQVFLISLKAGGTGLNLTAADVVFVLDPWWNPAAEAQAIARAHRIGRSGAVLAQRLVSRGTIEESILDLQRDKLDLARAVVGDGEDTREKLTMDDLRLLISGREQAPPT